jgi:hypothetical protein
MRFIVGGQSLELTQQQVEQALRGVEPEQIRSHAIEVDGRKFPVKQAFALATGRDRLHQRPGTSRDVQARVPCGALLMRSASQGRQVVGIPNVGDA